MAASLYIHALRGQQTLPDVEDAPRVYVGDISMFGEGQLSTKLLMALGISSLPVVDEALLTKASLVLAEDEAMKARVINFLSEHMGDRLVAVRY